MEPIENTDSRPTRPPLNDAQADALLEQKRKQSVSGLSWDEVTEDNPKGWRQTTEMGEGD